MVKKLFWENPYCTELKIAVCTVQHNQITCQETIFYAFSGGQESDGTIGGKLVLDAKKQGLDMIYTLADGHKLKLGDTLTMHIHWDRRLKLMRLHFAAELLLVLMYRKFPQIEKIGVHIAQDKNRLYMARESISFNP